MPFRKLLNSLAQELQSGLQGAGGGSGGNGYGFGGGYGGFGGYGGGGGGGNPFSPSPFTSASPPSIPQANVPCPRQQPQAGFQDWIGLADPRYAYFNICPSCYNSAVRPTPYAQSFVTKGPPANPTVPIRCDMSRFWVKVAGMVLLTMNNDGRLGVDFLARVAALASSPPEQGGQGQPMCPNAQLRSEAEPLVVVDATQDPQRRTWYTLFDPHTRAQLLPGWNICGSCAVNVMTCCPAVSGGLAPIQPHPGQGITCALVPSEYYDDPRTMAILQQIAACAVTSGFMRRPDMSALVNWLRANLPPPRGPGVGGASQGIPGGLGGAPPLPKGLCPRDYPSTTLRCRTMQGLFDFTVCEQCYKEVVEGDFNRGIGLAVRLGGAPAAAVGGAGFTCQLYSERMRRVWKEAVNMDEPMGFEHLRVKVNERKAKEREL